MLFSLKNDPQNRRTMFQAIVLDKVNSIVSDLKAGKHAGTVSDSVTKLYVEIQRNSPPIIRCGTCSLSFDNLLTYYFKQVKQKTKKVHRRLQRAKALHNPWDTEENVSVCLPTASRISPRLMSPVL